MLLTPLSLGLLSPRNSRRISGRCLIDLSLGRSIGAGLDVDQLLGDVLRDYQGYARSNSRIWRFVEDLEMLGYWCHESDGVQWWKRE